MPDLLGFCNSFRLLKRERKGLGSLKHQPAPPTACLQAVHMANIQTAPAMQT
ncbi:MAG: hypothetical protein ACFNLD_01375 [Kingella oralis]